MAEGRTCRLLAKRMAYPNATTKRIRHPFAAVHGYDELMPPMTRRDAARNREHLLAVAQQMRHDGQALQLNELARRAGLGVGTVYRHFATVQELAETLVADHLVELEAGAAAIDDEQSLRAYLVHALGLLVSDDDFASVATHPQPALESTRQARQQLIAALAAALDRIQVRQRMAPGLESADILLLLCGLAYAVRSGGLDPQRVAAYTQAFFDGIFASNS